MPSEGNPLVRLWRILWLRVALFALVGVGAIVFAVGLWTARHAEPIVRASILNALQQHFRSRVEMDGFHFTFLHPSLTGGTAEAEIDGVRIWLPEPDSPQQIARQGTVQETPGFAQPGFAQPWFAQPWISVRHLRFTASLSILDGRPLRLSNVQVDGVRLLIPPKGYRPRLVAAQPDSSNPAPPSPAPTSRLHTPSVVVDQIICSDVFLEMERMPALNAATASMGKTAAKPSAGTPLLTAQPSSGKPMRTGEQPPQPTKQPLQFQIASLILNPGQRSAPIRFRLRMTNPRPVGLILATGELGPWTMPEPESRFDPGALPIRGSYRFEHADLATFRGIGGILTSTGNFTGILRQVQVDGQADTPDFRLTRHEVVPAASVGLHLWTRFSATVDGTNGDTVLHTVEATLGETHMWASGQIRRVEYMRAATEAGAAQPAIGHDIQLRVRVDHGQIADLLQVATANPSPLVTGAVTLTNVLHLPPGEESFRDRLALDGQLDATGVRFTSDEIERKLTQLSLRGQGHPEALHQGQIAPVTSTMSGHFALAGSVLALSDLVYQVPGAEIHLHGTYALEGGALDFNGDARTQAALSQMVGGWKGMLLRPMNRIFAKNGAGTDVPIRLTGTRAEPHIAIDFSQIGKPGSADVGKPENNP